MAESLAQALFVVNLAPRRMAGDISKGMLFDLGYAPERARLRRAERNVGRLAQPVVSSREHGAQLA